MPEITLSQEQYQRLQEVRSDVETAFVDTYGRTRIEDAVEYLLDSCPPPSEHAESRAHERIETAEYTELQRVASDVPGVTGSGIPADEMREQLIDELGAAELLSRLEPLDPKHGDAEETTPHAERGDTQDSTAEGRAAEPSPDSGSESATTLPGPINRLLENHTDKWREGEGDEPYEVDLPGGESVAARTKDDVRQILFKNYR